MASTRRESLPIKDLINFLFNNVVREDGLPYRTQDVCEQVSISHATINQLRTGRSKNPILPTLQEICHFFDVPLTFFECSTYEECYAILAERGKERSISTEASEIAFRAQRLSLHGQRDILKVIKWVEAAEREQHDGDVVASGR